MFSPRDFFSGHLTTHSVIKNRSGDVTRYFTATIAASWSNEPKTLLEGFEFNDGEIQFRTGTLTPKKSGKYIATVGDVIGTGVTQISGNAMQFDYVVEIDYRTRKAHLDVEDWRWRVDEKAVINQAILRKWGFKVGSNQLAIIKH